MRINLNIEVSKENKIKKTMSQYNPTVNLNKKYRFTKHIDLQIMWGTSLWTRRCPD